MHIIYTLIKIAYTITIPLLYLVILGIIIFSQTPLGFGSLLIVILGLIIAISGLHMWIFSFIALNKSLSVYPEARTLVTTGLYHWCKHPFYLGINLSFLGLSISKGSWYGMFLTLFLIVPLHVFRAYTEDQILRVTFGKEYTNYCQQVKCKWL